MGTSHKIILTAAELSYLWTSYLLDNMSICVFRMILTQENCSVYYKKNCFQLRNPNN
ncbi:hypothetical protein NDK25_13730 [Niallia taxi]|nr:hypothetical protein [Niallia taxi]MDE5053294.1 hypothetical protein [Niallia taxi]